MRTEKEKNTNKQMNISEDATYCLHMPYWSHGSRFKRWIWDHENI